MADFHLTQCSTTTARQSLGEIIVEKLSHRASPLLIEDSRKFVQFGDATITSTGTDKSYVKLLKRTWSESNIFLESPALAIACSMAQSIKSNRVGFLISRSISSPQCGARSPARRNEIIDYCRTSPRRTPSLQQTAQSQARRRRNGPIANVRPRHSKPRGAIP